jgi:hypothetical protein
MAKKLKLRPSAWAFAITAWDIYRRLPAKQRKKLHGLVIMHGPKVAKKVTTTVTNTAAKRKASKTAVKRK